MKNVLLTAQITPNQDTLLQGVYDGNITCGELKENGDFGLGAFNALKVFNFQA